MPLIPLSLLVPDGRPARAADALCRLAPGLVLASGQAASGKLTLLTSLAQRLAGTTGAVHLVTDRPREFDPFLPRPPSWTLHVIEATPDAWRRALESLPAGDLVLVTPLTRVNAPAVVAAASGRWMLATMETPLTGLDVGPGLREMGVDYASLCEVLRGLWAQFLVEALCQRCATAAVLDPDEAELLRFHGVSPDAVRQEVGCAQCDGKGVDGRTAVYDILLVPHGAGAVVRSALEQGRGAGHETEGHVSGLDEALRLLGAGSIGIATYRAIARRNPVFKAWGALAAAQMHARKLGAMLDSTVASRWLDLEVLTAVADRTTSALVVVEEGRRVRFANAAARQALAGASAVSIAGDELTSASARGRRLLEEAIAAAVGHAPVATRLPAPTGSTEPVTFVTPLSPGMGFGPQLQRLALVVVAPRHAQHLLPSEAALRECFDFTPAECRVARLLCGGSVPKAIARDLGLSVATVRSHLSAALRKTGTARQAELVQLLASFPAR